MANLLPRNPEPPARLIPALLAVMALSLVWVVLVSAGQVTEVDIYQRGDQLQVDVVATDLLDQRTSMTIESGLPGTCVYGLRLEDDEQQPVVERWVEMSLRFDLWENIYRLDGLGGPRSFTTLAAADSAWSRIEVPGFCAAARLRSDASYRLILTIAVQPLAPEDRERLSRYVSRNSGGGGEELALDVGKVLARLFRGTGNGKRSGLHVGEFFRLGDLEVRE